MYTYPDSELAPHGVELGAQMIHGSMAETWELIREFNIQTSPLDFEAFEWSPDGQRNAI